MTTESVDRRILSATFARDFAEVMSAWHTLRTMVREQFPAASEEEVFQITSKLMTRALRHAAKLEAAGAKPPSVVSHQSSRRRAGIQKPRKRQARVFLFAAPVERNDAGERPVRQDMHNRKERT